MVTGLAWTVPTAVVVAPAPVYAASPCDTPATGSVSFAGGGNYSRTSAAAGTASVTMSDGSPLTVTFSSAMSAGYTRSNTGNLLAGPGAAFPNALTLLQTRTDSNVSPTRGQTLTIGFSRPVFNLVLPVSCFSWPTSSTSYQDAAWVSPAPSSPAVKGSNVIGTGTQADPFRNPATGNSPGVPYSGPTTTATLTYSGGTAGISSVTVQYFDRLAGSDHSQQGIAILDFAFETTRTGC